MVPCGGAALTGLCPTNCALAPEILTMAKRTLSLLLLLVLLLSSVGPGSAAQPAPLTEPRSFHSSPVMFIQNAGQFAGGARFQVRGSAAGTIWLADDAIWLTLVERASPFTPDMQADGRSTPLARTAVEGAQPASRAQPTSSSRSPAPTPTHAWSRLIAWIPWSASSSAASPRSGAPACPCGAACGTLTSIPVWIWSSAAKAGS